MQVYTHLRASGHETETVLNWAISFLCQQDSLPIAALTRTVLHVWLCVCSSSETRLTEGPRPTWAMTSISASASNRSEPFLRVKGENMSRISIFWPFKVLKTWDSTSQILRDKHICLWNDWSCSHWGLKYIRKSMCVGKSAHICTMSLISIVLTVRAQSPGSGAERFLRPQLASWCWGGLFISLPLPQSHLENEDSQRCLSPAEILGRLSGQMGQRTPDDLISHHASV